MNWRERREKFSEYNRDYSMKGLPRWHHAKESACQYRRHKRFEFSPWVGKILWRRTRQHTPVFLPGKFHGQRSLVGFSIQGHRDLDTTEQTHTHTHTHTHKMQTRENRLRKMEGGVRLKGRNSCLNITVKFQMTKDK